MPLDDKSIQRLTGHINRVAKFMGETEPPAGLEHFAWMRRLLKGDLSIPAEEVALPAGSFDGQ
jgi:hypothetical protein